MYSAFHATVASRADIHATLTPSLHILSKSQAKPKVLPCKTPSPIHGHTATALGHGRILVLGGTAEDTDFRQVSGAFLPPSRLWPSQVAQDSATAASGGVDYKGRGGRGLTSWLAHCGVLDVNTRTWEVIQASGQAPVGCYEHCTAVDERRGRVLLLGRAGLFALSLETWLWGRLGQAKEPWYLPHLGPPPAPVGYPIKMVPKGFTAAVLHDRLVIMGGHICCVWNDEGDADDPVC
jgi:hypothetical protein